MIPATDSDEVGRSTLRHALGKCGLDSAQAKPFEADPILVLIESTSAGYSACAPNFVGCISTGRTLEEVEIGIREAVAGYLEELRHDGRPMPAPTVSATYVNVRLL